MGKIFYVYKHLKKSDNTVFYIGKGQGKRSHDIGRGRRNSHHQRIVEKHGIIVKIIEKNLSEEEAFALEIELITNIGRYDLGTGPLVNMTDGGDGYYNPSPETREKMRKSAIGRKHTEESKAKMSKNSIGQPSSMLGKAHQEKTKKKIAESVAAKFTDDRRVAYSKIHSVKVINCKDQVFNSHKDAAKHFGFKSASGISNNLIGTSKSAGKYPDGTKIVWSYLKD